jgi:hypothetical protein
MVDNPYYIDHPWLTAATDGRLTLIFNPRDLTGSPPTFAGSGMQAATSTTGQTWETHDIVPLEAQRNMYIGTGSVDKTTSYALFYDLAAPFGQTLKKSVDGKVWSSTAVLPGRAGAYVGDAVRSASHGSDVWLLYGLAGEGGGESSAAVYHQGLALVHSSDGGNTWESGWMIVGDGRLYMLPELTVERTGALDLVYYAATRDLDPDASFEWVRSTDAGATWTRPVVLQRRILFKAQRRVPDWLGDYVAMATDDDFAYFAWTSNETGQAMVEYARRSVR